MYPVVLTRLMIFEWLFYCFFSADHRKTRRNSGYRNRGFGGAHA